MKNWLSRKNFKFRDFNKNNFNFGLRFVAFAKTLFIAMCIINLLSFLVMDACETLGRIFVAALMFVIASAIYGAVV